MVFGLARTPQKYEERALKYESKGNLKKAAKNRAKAARLGGPAQVSKPAPTIPATIVVVPTVRSAAEYEAKAIKWEQRGDWTKAQKNREKVWRMNNKQLGNGPAPTFYRDNRFIGYADAYTTVGQVPVETHVHPTIIEQTVRTEKVTEIQPIIHREVDAPQVRVIEQHSYETVPSAGPGVITNQAVVETTVRPRVIEEIQPIVHREVAVPHVERVEQHVTEHVVKPTITTKEVITDSHVGVQYR